MKTYYANFSSPAGRVHTLAGETGLAALYFDSQVGDMERRFPSASRSPGRGNFWLLQAEAFVACYFAGDLDFFPEIPLELHGTPSRIEVWNALGEIPPGRTTTYGELARRIGKPKAARAVGAAVGANPISLIIPCHRVIGASGDLTGYAGGLEVKKFLLEHERTHSIH